MKNVMIISASPRKNGNSDILCTNFKNGALAAGHNVEKIDLRDKNIGYCIGCYACTKLGKCFQNDDMNELAKKLENADVIVLATPVYFYSMDAQLKTFIDRTVQNYTKIRADIYIMATAWDPDTANLESTVEAVRGFSRDCLEECPEKGVIIAGGVSEKGDINKTKYPEQAYNMGLNC